MTKITLKRIFTLLCLVSCLFSMLLFTSCGDCEHVWDNGKVAKEPTDMTEGAKIYTCSECKEQRYESIPKLKHNPKSHTYEKAIWGGDGTYHWLICDHPDCDATTGKTNHTLTDTPNGGHMCQVCKKTVSGHSFSTNMECKDNLHWVKCDEKDCPVIAHYNVHTWVYKELDEGYHMTSCGNESCPLERFAQEHSWVDCPPKEDGTITEQICSKCNAARYKPEK